MNYTTTNTTGRGVSISDTGTAINTKIQDLYDKAFANAYLQTYPLSSSMNLNFSSMDFNFNCFNLKKKLFKHISVDEVVKGKVYKFTFDNKTKIKTVYSDDDINFFSFDYAVCLAIAKYMFKDVLTFEGILEEAYILEKLKPIQKIIKQLEKEVKEQRKEKEKKKEYEEIKKRQHARYVRRKIERKERKKQEQIDIIKQAIK